MSTKEQTLAREVASLTGRTYTDALREVRETPTIVADGYVYQPLRLMAEGRTANIAGHPIAVIDMARRVQESLRTFGSSVAVEVFVRPDEIDRGMVMRSMQGLDTDDPAIIMLANTTVAPLDPGVFFHATREAEQQALDAAQRIIRRSEVPYDPATATRPGTAIFAYDTNKRPVPLDLVPGRAVYVVGRPASGKSVLAGIVFDQARHQGWKVLNVLDVGPDTDLARAIVYADQHWTDDMLQSGGGLGSVEQQIRDLQQRSALVWLETQIVLPSVENITTLMMSRYAPRLLVNLEDASPTGTVPRVDEATALQWMNLGQTLRDEADV